MRFSDMRGLRSATATAVGLGVLAAFTMHGDAHKAITSKYTYNDDVYPIFASRCGHCHVAGGVAPMSLVTYEDAFPWSESLRAELLDESSGTDFVDVAHQQMSARELDVVLDWAVGGTPEGSAAKPPAPFALKNDWAGEPPDLILRPTAPIAIPADAMELTQDIVIETTLTAARQISAIDLLPGTPAVVRDAELLVRAGGSPPQSIGLWTPRQTPAAIAVRPGTTLPPGADLIARIHYKKTWKYEGQAMTDRSSIGLYFSDR